MKMKGSGKSVRRSEFELDLEGETRCGEKEAQPGGIQGLLGEDPKAGGILLAGRTAGEDCKGRLEKSARELFGRLQIPG